MPIHHFRQNDYPIYLQFKPWSLKFNKLIFIFLNINHHPSLFSYRPFHLNHQLVNYKFVKMVGYQLQVM
jgi:hypothetical protein